MPARSGRAAQAGGREPAVAGDLEVALESILVGVEGPRQQRECRVLPAG